MGPIRVSYDGKAERSIASDRRCGGWRSLRGYFWSHLWSDFRGLISLTLAPLRLFSQGANDASRRYSAGRSIRVRLECRQIRPGHFQIRQLSGRTRAQQSKRQASAYHPVYQKLHSPDRAIVFCAISWFQRHNTSALLPVPNESIVWIKERQPQKDWI